MLLTIRLWSFFILLNIFISWLFWFRKDSTVHLTLNFLLHHFWLFILEGLCHCLWFSLKLYLFCGVGFLRQNDRDSVDEDQESELSSEVPTEDSLITDLTSQMARFQLLHEQTRKPPGLTQEALNCLHFEVFSSIDMESESKVLQDCGICLESFVDGDKLIHLQCGHKFHSACLDPWIRSCGDCPYCRRCIVVNSHLP